MNCSCGQPIKIYDPEKMVSNIYAINGDNGHNQYVMCHDGHFNVIISIIQRVFPKNFYIPYGSSVSIGSSTITTSSDSTFLTYPYKYTTGGNSGA